MRLILVCRSSVSHPDFWLEVEDEEVKEDRCTELMEAYANPSKMIQVTREKPRYRVLDYEKTDDRITFLLVEAVPLH